VIASMDENGVLTLQAETSVEAFALRQWVGLSLIQFDDIMRNEQCYWRGSKLLVNGNTKDQL
jgi:hypothetical protein